MRRPEGDRSPWPAVTGPGRTAETCHHTLSQACCPGSKFKTFVTLGRSLSHLMVPSVRLSIQTWGSCCPVCP